jgi:precorrin-6A synthase
MRTVHVIGIGAGDPDFVTAQAIRALNDTRVFFVSDKGEDKRDLLELRREVCRRFITGSDYRFVELPDPPRAPDGDYLAAVADWHAARSRLWADAIGRELPPDGVGAFLAWGDPGLYDSTLRILDEVARYVEIRYDVIPGITAVQALTARHRIPLNDVGEPVLLTTGRKLRASLGAGGLTGSAVVMLDGDCAFLECPAQTRIWWGAYLGTPDELLASGTVGEVGEHIAALRADARERHGWIMDTYLLRA